MIAMNSPLPRRTVLAGAALAPCLILTDPCPVAANEGSAKPFHPPISLNTATIRGQNLSVLEQIDVAGAAGYDAIEPWIGDLRKQIEGGTGAVEIRRRIEDAGLQMVSAIGFARWIVDHPAERQAGLDEARSDMELVHSLGAKFIAAPPVGVHQSEKLPPAGPPSLGIIADRFAELCRVGQSVGVTPLLELWGFSPVLSTLAELAHVATAASGPGNIASVLPDFYHIHRGGSPMEQLRVIEASRMPLFHINDYPTDRPSNELTDADRVFPGDGDCPLVETIAGLLAGGFRGTFSLELFNRDYWSRDAGDVAAEGLQKTRKIITRAVAAAASQP